MKDIDLPLTEFTPGNEVARAHLDRRIAELEYKASFFEEAMRTIAGTTKDRKTKQYAKDCLNYPKAGRDWPAETVIPKP